MCPKPENPVGYTHAELAGILGTTPEAIAKVWRESPLFYQSVGIDEDGGDLIYPQDVNALVRVLERRGDIPRPD